MPITRTRPHNLVITFPIFITEEKQTMISLRKTTGAALAMTAAAMLATAPMSASASSHNGKCMGANSCKGLSSCKTATSSCKGLNSCKGKGFLEMSKAECDAEGGSFES